MSIKKTIIVKNYQNQQNNLSQAENKILNIIFQNLVQEDVIVHISYTQRPLKSGDGFRRPPKGSVLKEINEAIRTYNSEIDSFLSKNDIFFFDLYNLSTALYKSQKKKLLSSEDWGEKLRKKIKIRDFRKEFYQNLIEEYCLNKLTMDPEIFDIKWLEHSFQFKILCHKIIEDSHSDLGLDRSKFFNYTTEKVVNSLKILIQKKKEEDQIEKKKKKKK